MRLRREHAVRPKRRQWQRWVVEHCCRLSFRFVVLMNPSRCLEIIHKAQPILHSSIYSILLFHSICHISASKCIDPSHSPIHSSNSETIPADTRMRAWQSPSTDRALRYR